MPTPSDQRPHRDWSARTANPRRSVFGNYDQGQELPKPTPGPDPQEGPQQSRSRETEQPRTAIDVAMARSFVYRFLAKGFEDPTAENWAALNSLECRGSLASAIRALTPTAPELDPSARSFQSQLTPENFEVFAGAYVSAFGHAARGRCPLNEIEYGDIKADPLFQPHRLADLAAFYRAFGLEVTEDAAERHDHICLELEFMCVLSAKETFARQHDLADEQLSVCLDAQRKFLREHVARWVPAFTRRLARMADGTALGALASFTGAFIVSECHRFGVAPGNEDLLLRPVDASAESLCASCGVVS